MTPGQDNQQQAMVVAALRRVPPVHLAIFDLAQELIGQNGQVDTLRASERAEEVMAAVDQAQAYVEEVRSVSGQLQPIPRRRAWE